MENLSKQSRSVSVALPENETHLTLEQDQFLSLSAACQELGISEATGRNWIRLGKLTPSYVQKNSKYFKKDYILSLKNDIANGKNRALKSRRNKKFVSGRGLYGYYVSDSSSGTASVRQTLDLLSASHIPLDTLLIRFLLAEAAIQMITQRFSLQPAHLLDYLEGNADIINYAMLLDDLVQDKEAARKVCILNPQLFSVSYNWEPNEDILGLLYISCQNLKDRKATGSYYTPTSVVKKLVGNLDIHRGDEVRILDPCCGTGNFLLQLPDGIPPENIFGNDTDSISIYLTRINLALKYRFQETEVLYHNFTIQDYLLDYDKTAFDFVIGNPPWGFLFTPEQRKSLDREYCTCKGKNPESYDLFIEKAIKSVKQNGIVSFILPEAILNVKSHFPIRSALTDSGSIEYLEYLGNVFHGVQCPCIILQFSKTQRAMSCIGMKVTIPGETFTIQTKRKINPEHFSFALNDAQYQVLEKLESLKHVEFLEKKAIFALGIVTGDNKKYITSEKKTDNELVLKGSDLLKYRFTPSNHYIEFRPDAFQQVAPTEYYRAEEKLLYRFICNQLVFAYDNKQTLSLNSCNILIPQIEGMNCKYIMAVLNSRISQFFFQKKFYSVKVLRTHIEKIPIPNASEDCQKHIVDLVNRLEKSTDIKVITSLYEEIDALLQELFQLSEEEYSIIKKAVDQDNKFLY